MIQPCMEIGLICLCSISPVHNELPIAEFHLLSFILDIEINNFIVNTKLSETIFCLFRTTAA
jgi:hypothetical protein